MVIEGLYQQFVAWVSDDPKREADTVLYTLDPQSLKPTRDSRIDKACFPRELIEWHFDMSPGSQPVTITMLEKVVRRAFRVQDWII